MASAPSVSCGLCHSPLVLLSTFKSEPVAGAPLSNHHLRALQASLFPGLSLGQVSAVGTFRGTSAPWPGGVTASKRLICSVSGEQNIYQKTEGDRIVEKDFGRCEIVGWKIYRISHAVVCGLELSCCFGRKKRQGNVGAYKIHIVGKIWPLPTSKASLSATLILEPCALDILCPLSFLKSQFCLIPEPSHAVPSVWNTLL